MITTSPDSLDIDVGSRVDRLFLDAVDILHRAGTPILQATNRARALRVAVEGSPGGGDVPLSHDEDALDFNRAFFLKNLYKNLYNLEFAASRGLLPEWNHPMVVDIGAGGGVASIAWVLSRGTHLDGVFLVDHSRAQLRIASNLLALFGAEGVSLLNGSFPGEIRHLPSGYRLISYWLCEQRSLCLTAGAIADLFAQPGLVTDYPDAIGQLLSTHSSLRGLMWSFRTIPIGPVRHYLRQSAIRIHGAVIEQL